MNEVSSSKLQVQSSKLKTTRLNFEHGTWNLGLTASSFILPECEVAMKTWRWKSAARAACFVVALAFAGHLAAAVGARTSRAAHASRPCTRETVVRGRGLVNFGGY